MKEYLPTKSARARPGEPLGMRDILIAQINREDRGIEGFVRPANEPKATSLIDLPRNNPVIRNMFISQVWRQFRSVIA